MVFQDPDGRAEPAPDDLRGGRRRAAHPRSPARRGAARRRRAGTSGPPAAGALLPALPLRGLGRPAPTGRDRRGDGAPTAADRRRRARVEPRRLGARRDPAADAPARAGDGRDDPRRHPRPRARLEHRRPDRRDVPRPHRRGGPDRGAARRTRSTRTRARCSRSCRRSSGWSSRSSRARRRTRRGSRRAAASTRAARWSPRARPSGSASLERCRGEDPMLTRSREVAAGARCGLPRRAERAGGAATADRRGIARSKRARCDQPASSGGRPSSSATSSTTTWYASASERSSSLRLGLRRLPRASVMR